MFRFSMRPRAWRWGRRPKPGRLRRLRRCVAAIVLGAVAASVAVTASLRWIDPPTTAFMLEHVYGSRGGRPGRPLRHEWVDWKGISPWARLAVVAAEDQRFPEHAGFDLGSIAEAVEERITSGRRRGASTISQQVAKNLFLWPGKSLVRKALEAWFTVWIEACWPKQRVLEVYLNVAQFGENVFGIEAASRTFFGKPARSLSRREAAILAAVLPNPVRLRADDPSDYVRSRADWIVSQMEMLGGPGYVGSLGE